MSPLSASPLAEGPRQRWGAGWQGQVLSAGFLEVDRYAQWAHLEEQSRDRDLGDSQGQCPEDERRGIRLMLPALSGHCCTTSGFQLRTEWG